MLWLYWRRVRLPVMVTGAVFGALAALVVVAGAVGGASLRPVNPRTVGAHGARRATIAPLAATPQARRGLALMSHAVMACQAVPYHGIQIVAWTDAGSSRSYLVRVWHWPGSPALAEDDDDAESYDFPGADQPASASGSDAAVGVLSISPWMLRLLRANYQIEYAGTSTSSGRPAAMVVMLRRDGTLAARFWLDRQTGLPLRRELFDQHGSKVSEGAFIDLEVGHNSVGILPIAQARSWSAQSGRLAVASLRKNGWTVPGRLAGNLGLVGITRTSTRSGAVVDASYSDGLSVVSVFMQRGELPQALPGWHQTTIGGDPVWRSRPTGFGERGIAWSANGHVYTVIADAPAVVVTDVVAQLPHGSDGGLWQRVGRGLERIASWFNPFS